MAATALTVTDISRAGVAPSLAAFNADGHLLPNTGKEFVMVTNGSGSAVTVSAAIVKTVDGVTPAAKSMSVPAAGTKLFGPFKPEEYNNASAQVALSVSLATDVTIQALRLTPVN
jgi:hypothetical protein